MTAVRPVRRAGPILPLWWALAACAPAAGGAADGTANGADVSDHRLTQDVPVNQSGPLAVPLFDDPAGAWTLAGPGGACAIVLEPQGADGGAAGRVDWPPCAALPFTAVRWTLDADGLTLRTEDGAAVARFPTDRLPPLDGEGPGGAKLTLTRR